MFPLETFNILTFYGAFIVSINVILKIILIQIWQSALKVGVFIHLHLCTCAHILALENDSNKKFFPD